MHLSMILPMSGQLSTSSTCISSIVIQPTLHINSLGNLIFSFFLKNFKFGSSFKQQMHVTNKRWNEMWKCEMETVMIWGIFWLHHEAYKKTMNFWLFVFFDTLYDKHNIKTNWIRWTDRGWRIWNELMNDKQARSKLQGVMHSSRDYS